MIDLIALIISSSLSNLFNNQPDIFSFTSETGETEWNLTHHIANEINKYISWLDCDIDLTKQFADNRRPDVIFHKRDIHALNFLVIELKHRGVSNYEDISKIREYWMGEILHYRFGASIRIIDREHHDFIVFEYNGKVIEGNQSTKYISVPTVDLARDRNFKEIVKRIKDLGDEENGKVEGYKRQIDQMVYELYGLTRKELE